MATRLSSWYGRHHELVAISVLAPLLVVIAVESFFLYQERTVNNASRSQNAQLLSNFLQGDTAHVAGAGNSVLIRLQNVRFKWSDKVYIDTGDMAVRATPLSGSTVDFDDLDSFLLNIQRSTVLIRPDVLEAMFNESVFNYPESKIRRLKVALVDDEGVQKVRLKGDINVVTWIPFTMDTRLSVDQSNNTLVIDPDHLKIFGFLSASKLLKMHPFHLDKLISLPPNKSLMVVKNRMMVKPFGLFPPPRINGTMQNVSIENGMIKLTFAGNPIPAPQSPGNNYVYLRGGTSQFGHFRMVDTNVLIEDKNPGNSFTFSLLRYAEMIPRSDIEIHNTKSVRVTMPDM